MKSRPLIAIVALTECLLMCVTWRLWMQASEFPVVPLFGATAERGLIVFVSGVLFASCSALSVTTLTCCSERITRLLMTATIVAGLASVVLNQHCLQPWHWLTLLMLIVCSVSSPTVVRQLVFQILASLYVCAGLSRITADVQGSMTWQLLDAALQLVGANEFVPDGSRIVMCHVMTGVEILIGVLLAVPRMRRIGVPLAIALHVVLIVLLSPLGLNHEPAVLIWNVALGVMLVAASRMNAIVEADGSGSAGASPSRLRPRVILAAIAIWVMPLSGLFGVFDNWPSWQVYSPRPERWSLSVHVDDVDRLPHSLLEMIDTRSVFGDWCPIPLDRWSLESTGVPMYPEDRFQRAVIRQVLGASNAEPRFRIDISEPQWPDWWNRTEREIDDRAALD